jgi:hypothetical protein
MNTSRRILLLTLLALVPVLRANEQTDPGRAPIGAVAVIVYHATDGDPKAAGARAVAVDEATAKRFRSEKRLQFRHYRRLGADTQPLLRSYESWAEPFKPSHELLVRFEAQGRSTADSASLDLELWLSGKKTIKTYSVIERDRPLLVLGPEWRGGRLMIEVAMATQPGKDP